MRATHKRTAKHEKDGKRMLMNRVRRFRREKKNEKIKELKRKEYALGFSLRTTFAQQIESAVTYSARLQANEKQNEERVWI